MTGRTRNATISCAAILALMSQAAPGALFTFDMTVDMGAGGPDGQDWQQQWGVAGNWAYVSGTDDGITGIPDGADTFTIDRTSNSTGATRLTTESAPGGLVSVAGITGTGTGNEDIVFKLRDFTIGDLTLLPSGAPFHIYEERDKSLTINGVISGSGDLLLSRGSGFSDGTQTGELITITGSSPNTITGSIRLWNSNAGSEPSYWVADKVGAFGQAPTLTLEGNTGSTGATSLQFTANTVGGEGAIDDDATTVYIGAQGVLSMDAGVNETIGIGKLFIDLAGTGTYAEVAPGTYDNSEAWIIGDGTVSVGPPATGPMITSITGIGGGVWELTLEGEESTDYEFRSSPILDFNPGTLVENLTAGGTPVGTIDGANDSVLTTDSNGDGTVRMTLTGPKNFVVTQIPPPLLEADFELDNGGFTFATAAGTDWDHGMPDSDSPGGAVTEGNDSSLNCWGTNLGTYAGGTGDEGYYLIPSTITRLRSSVVDLTGIAGASLTFAEALDLAPGDTAVVNIIEELTDTIVAGGAAIYTADDSATTGDANWNAVPGIDLTPVVGQKVRIEWVFTGATDQYIGWYIDDVVVTQGAP